MSTPQGSAENHARVVIQEGVKPFTKPHSDRYPYLVIRWASCAYDVRGIDLRAEPSDLRGSSPRFVVSVEAELDEHARRRAVIDACHEIVARSGRRCCVVFALDDAVYCEPGGAEEPSTTRPSGGVDVHGFALTSQRRVVS